MARIWARKSKASSELGESARHYKGVSENSERRNVHMEVARSGEASGEEVVVGGEDEVVVVGFGGGISEEGGGVRREAVVVGAVDRVHGGGGGSIGAGLAGAAGLRLRAGRHEGRGEAVACDCRLEKWLIVSSASDSPAATRSRRQERKPTTQLRKRVRTGERVRNV